MAKTLFYPLIFVLSQFLFMESAYAFLFQCCNPTSTEKKMSCNSQIFELTYMRGSLRSAETEESAKQQCATLMNESMAFKNFGVKDIKKASLEEEHLFNEVREWLERKEPGVDHSKNYSSYCFFRQSFPGLSMGEVMALEREKKLNLYDVSVFKQADPKVNLDTVLNLHRHGVPLADAALFLGARPEVSEKDLLFLHENRVSFKDAAPFVRKHPMLSLEDLPAIQGDFVGFTKAKALFPGMKIRDWVVIKKHALLEHLNKWHDDLPGISLHEILEIGTAPGMKMDEAYKILKHQLLDVTPSKLAQMANEGPNPFQSVYTACHNKDRPQDPSPIHLNWMGGRLPPEKKENVNKLCESIKKYQTEKSVNDEKLMIHLWFDERNNIDHGFSHECDGLIRTHRVEKLINEKNNLWSKEIFQFFYNSRVFAGASDILRPLMLKKYGGCYMDIGFSPSVELIETLRDHNAFHKDFFVYDTNKAGFHNAYNRQHNTIPYMSTYNNFMAASSKSETLDSLINDFKKKTEFFATAPIIRAYAQACQMDDLVFDLVGQGGFNQALYNILKKDKNKFDLIHRVGLDSIIPYRGSSSWKMLNGGPTGCEMFFTCMKSEIDFEDRTNFVLRYFDQFENHKPDLSSSDRIKEFSDELMNLMLLNSPEQQNRLKEYCSYLKQMEGTSFDPNPMVRISNVRDCDVVPIKAEEWNISIAPEIIKIEEDELSDESVVVADLFNKMKSKGDPVYGRQVTCTLEGRKYKLAVPLVRLTKTSCPALWKHSDLEVKVDSSEKKKKKVGSKSKKKVEITSRKKVETTSKKKSESSSKKKSESKSKEKTAPLKKEKR